MINFEPLFIKGQSGRLFATYSTPLKDKPIIRAILHIPAFAEEMNKARRMVALQTREFTKAGYAVLVLDLFGTGDSEGDFSAATWSIWKQDINTAYEWLMYQGMQDICLWSLRLGSLLALDFIAETKHKVDHLLCWHPILQGDIYVTQFLRLRVAAAMLDTQAPQEKIADLKQHILQGGQLEVAGYTLNPALIKPLMTLSANKIDFTPPNTLTIFEIINNTEKTVSPVFSKFADDQQQRGNTVTLKTVVGSPFWSTQEISEVQALLPLTLSCLR